MDGHQAIRLPFLSPILPPPLFHPNRSQGWCTHFSMILGIPSSKEGWRGSPFSPFTTSLLPADDQVLAEASGRLFRFFAPLVYCGQRFLGLFAFGGRLL
ncbi:hypothetical protein AVEN_215524-1 [Araneus ventricosus]|uniref:Uncharacterized protein n=1 Tax=Araneus ventricosus TaxID=182803 RepID=A0A4Y2BFN1_ARAVE|nr:hypothetical protein AVEN_215524-1 [Araneus ventricosus]